VGPGSQINPSKSCPVGQVFVPLLVVPALSFAPPKPKYALTRWA